MFIPGEFKSFENVCADCKGLAGAFFVSAYCKGLKSLSAELAGADMRPVRGNTGFASADTVPAFCICNSCYRKAGGAAARSAHFFHLEEKAFEEIGPARARFRTREERGPPALRYAL